MCAQAISQGAEAAQASPQAAGGLRVEDVHTYYGASHILHGVTLEARRGRATAILGRNGVGKTTLIRSIMGFTPPASGRVLLDGEPVQHLPSYRIAQLGFGLVPQGRRIFPSLTVEENLLLATQGARAGRRSASGRSAGAAPAGGSTAAPSAERSLPTWDLAAVCDMFPRLKERRRHFGNQLSGGEQQMLAIGRALMTNPSFVLMDEPSEGLAPIIVQGLGDTISRLRETGLGVVLVEQHLPLALSCCEDAYIISKGKVVYGGAIRTIVEDEDIRRQHLAV